MCVWVVTLCVCVCVRVRVRVRVRVHVHVHAVNFQCVLSCHLDEATVEKRQQLP